MRFPIAYFFTIALVVGCQGFNTDRTNPNSTSQSGSTFSQTCLQQVLLHFTGTADAQCEQNARVPNVECQFTVQGTNQPISPPMKNLDGNECLAYHGLLSAMCARGFTPAQIESYDIRCQ